MKIEKLPMSMVVGPYGSIMKRLIFHVGLGCVIVFIIQLFLDDLTIVAYLRTLCLYVVNDFVFTTGHMLIFYNLDLSYDWLKNTVARSILAVVFHTVFSAVAFLLVQLVLMNVLFGMNIWETVDWYFEMWYIPVGLTVMIIVFTTTVGFFQKWKRSLIEEEKMRTEMMSYKFESLKGQINPSFLFESFGSLKILIDKEPKKAVEVIQKMSKLYRSVLETKDMELVSLQDELDLVTLYFDLLSLRFKSKLSFELAVEANNADRVVPVVLQNVIEKLLCYATEDSRITFSLNREKGSILIESNILVDQPGNFDVDNLQRRYEFFTNQKIEISSEGSKTEISVPILVEEI